MLNHNTNINISKRLMNEELKGHKPVNQSLNEEWDGKFPIDFILDNSYLTRQQAEELQDMLFRCEWDMGYSSPEAFLDRGNDFDQIYAEEIAPYINESKNKSGVNKMRNKKVRDPLNECFNKLFKNILCESSIRDDTDASADDKKEAAKKAFMRKKDDADSDKDYRLKKAGLKEPRALKESTGKIRIIYDLCTPTRDRRPTTKEDVYDDVHIKEFDDIEALYDHLLDMVGIDREEDEEGYREEGLKVPDIKKRCINLLGYFDDPGDGSPNILYLNIDGEEINEDVFPYDGMENLDLANCSEEEVQENIIDNNGYSEDDDWDDVFNESLKRKSLKESDKPAATSIKDAQKWVDYDMKKYGKISEKTNKIIKKAGFQIIKDDHGDYEVTAGKFEKLKK